MNEELMESPGTATTKALVKKEGEGLIPLSFDEWLKENNAMLQNQNKISPWLAAIIGIGAFFLGALIIAVVFLGVYVISMNRDHGHEHYRYESERDSPRTYYQVPATSQLSPQPRVSPPLARTEPPAYRDGMGENAPTLNGTVKLQSSGYENVTEVPHDFIMLKPPAETGRKQKTYPATPPDTQSETIPANPYAIPPGVILEKGR